MHNNPSLPPQPLLSSGYYILGDSILVCISGITFDIRINAWCYNLEIVADRTKTLTFTHPAPLVDHFDSLLPKIGYKRLDDKKQVRSLEVLFQTAPEIQDTWVAGINEDQITSSPKVSEAESDDDAF